MQRTTHDPQHPATSYRLRVPTPDDAEAFAAVRLASWRAAYRGVFDERVFVEQEQQNPQRVEGYRWWFEQMDATGRDTEARTEAQRRGLVAVDAADRLVGVASTRTAPGETTELTMLYTLPEVFGAGVGQMLLNELLGDQPARLEVIAANPRAIAFYRKHGFAETGKTSTFSGHKTLVMAR